MKATWPGIALLLAAQSSSGEAACYFGTFQCFDGESYCFNPLAVASCTFNAVSPIVLDQIIPAFGNALKELTPDQFDGLIDLGEKEISRTFTNLIDCAKLFGGKVAKCEVLHDVHACVSTAMLAAKEMKVAGKFANMAVEQVGRADKTLNVFESQVIPELQKQCAAGCYNDATCSAPANTSGQVVTTTTTTTTKTECYNATVDPTPITLQYTAPQGCTCLKMTVEDFNFGSEASTTDTCALNLAFNMGTKRLGKAYFPEMGCFVGKSTNNGCVGANPLDRSQVELTYDFDWELNDMQFLRFIPCVDQFGRKYSERTKEVPPTPTPTYCKTFNVTTTTNTTTNSTSTTKAKNFATVLTTSIFAMMAACVVLLAASMK